MQATDTLPTKEMQAQHAPLVAIITLNWNRPRETLAFLASCAQLAYPMLRTLVVDNASQDDSVAQVATHFPHAELVVNEHNLGFAAGMNVGMRRAMALGADYVFLANNDTVIAPNAIDALVETAQASQADIASPAIYYAQGSSRIWWTGGYRRWPTLEIRPCAEGELGAGPLAVDFVTGCGMLISRRCIERVGLFDERFFMYYEDSDYCLRARAAGYSAIVVPHARMWHRVATSLGGSGSPGERYHIARSSVQFFRKHTRGWAWLLVGPYRSASALRTLLRLVRRRQGRAAAAHLRGLWHGATR